MGTENERIGGESKLPTLPPRTPSARPEPRPVRVQTAGSGTSGTQDSGTGTRTGKAEEKKLAGLAPVKPKENVTITPTGEVVAPKPKKKRQSKPKETQTFGADQFSGVLGAIGEIMAARLGEHWRLSKKECDSIAAPACKLIAKNEQLQKLAEHSDALALVAATTMVVAPRVLIDVQMGRFKKKTKVVKKDAGKSKASVAPADAGSSEQHSEQPGESRNVADVSAGGGKFAAEIDGESFGTL